MNILILNWRDVMNPKSGGAEIVTLEHAKAWVEAGNKVTWFSSSFKKAKRTEEIKGVRVVRYGNFITVYLFAPIYYIFSKQKFDIVIDQIHGIPFFTPLYVRKPKIAFIHEVANEIWDYMYPFPINKIGRLTERVLLIPYKNIQFITVSKSTAEELRKYGIKSIKIITNGIHVLKHSNIKKEVYPTFIFVSRIVKMKGIEDVLSAFFLINEKLDKSKLWIVGEGEKKYIKTLKNKFNLNSNKNIKFFDFVPENKKLELMKKAHIMLHASIKEGWGLVVIEAASQGTPSVVYNVPGLRDSVKNNETGVITSKNNPHELAIDSLNLFSNKNKYHKLSLNCVNYAKSLDWKKSTKLSLDLLEKVGTKNEKK